MIEKYFQKGIRLTWVKPGDGQLSLDGKVVDSSRAASAMKYDGLDGELINPLFMTSNVTAMGFTKNMPIQYDWLDYAPGSTARKRLGGADLLTGYMSGCIIAVGTSVGVKYAYHVGTIDSMPDVTKKVKQEFGRVMGNDTMGYDPFKAWPTGEIEAVKAAFKSKPRYGIFSLVTSTGSVYSLLMFNVPKGVFNFDPTKVVAMVEDNWCVGGIKRVAPMTPPELTAKMRP